MRAATKLNVITMIVLLLAGCATMETRWQEVVSKNTIQDYQAFLREYPDSQYAISAKEKIELLRWRQRVSKLRDIDAKVRRRTALDLGGRGDKRAVEPLAHSLRKDEDVSVREQAAAALAKIGDKRAVEPLVAAMEDESPIVRSAALKALEKLGWKPESDSERFIFLVEKRDWKTCLKLDKPATIDALIELLTHWETEESVRSEVVSQLNKIRDESLVEPLIKALKHHAAQEPAVRILGMIGDTRAVEPVIMMLKDDDPLVRWTAATALGKLGDKRAVEPLARSLITDERIRVREHAAAALAKIGDTRAVEPLIAAALKDAHSTVRVAASSVLLDMADPRATDVYIKILDLSDPDMRLRAAKLLVASKDPKVANVRARALEVVEVETSCLVEETDYTVFGQAFKVVLRNRMGKDVASRRIVHEGSFIVSETLTDLSTGKEIRTWTFGPGGKRIETPMFLCLDEKGDIIRDKKGNPVMVKAFSADQRQVTSARYDGYNPTIKTSETTRIYPCQNCVAQTGIKDCYYVW